MPRVGSGSNLFILSAAITAVFYFRPNSTTPPTFTVSKDAFTCQAYFCLRCNLFSRHTFLADDTRVKCTR
jgi:hypothetical protein